MFKLLWRLLQQCSRKPLRRVSNLTKSVKKNFRGTQDKRKRTTIPFDFRLVYDFTYLKMRNLGLNRFAKQKSSPSFVVRNESRGNWCFAKFLLSQLAYLLLGGRTCSRWRPCCPERSPRCSRRRIFAKYCT
jgi:hypothetical protein